MNCQDDQQDIRLFPRPTFDENSHRSFEKLAITRPGEYTNDFAEMFIVLLEILAMTSTSSSSSAPKIFLTEEFILRRVS